MKLPCIICLSLYLGACSSSEQALPLPKEKEVVSCACPSDRKIATPQFIDEESGFIFCFDDINSMYDEFQSRNFRIISCESDAELFNSINRSYDLKVMDSIIEMKLEVGLPNYAELISSTSESPYSYGHTIFQYKLNRRTKVITEEAKEVNLDPKHLANFKSEYQKHVSDLRYLKSNRFIQKMLWLTMAFPDELKPIYVDVASKIRAAQVLETDAMNLDKYDYYFKIILGLEVRGPILR